MSGVKGGEGEDMSWEEQVMSRLCNGIEVMGAQFVVVFCWFSKWLVVGGKEAVSQGFWCC